MGRSSDHAGVIAPPPLLFAGALGIGLAVDFLLARVPTGLPAALRLGLAVLFILAGLALALGALRRFGRAGTEAAPWRPSTALVTDGVYAYTRNPMYLGMTLFYLAIALGADSVVALLFLPPLLVLVRFGVVLREERYLEATFGASYLRYKERVRRWI